MAGRRHSERGLDLVAELERRKRAREREHKRRPRVPKKVTPDMLRAKLDQVQFEAEMENKRVDDYLQDQQEHQRPNGDLLDTKLVPLLEDVPQTLTMLRDWKFGHGVLSNEVFERVLNATSGTLRNLILLEQLRFGLRNEGLSSSAIRALAHAARTLVKFTVFDCRQVGLTSRGALHTVVGNLGAVRELSLGDIPNVGSLDFGVLARSMPHLDTIRLFYAEKQKRALSKAEQKVLTDWIATVAPQLQTLELANMTDLVPGAVIDALALSGAPRLRSLKLLETGTLLVDRDLVQLQVACPNLRTLAVTHANLSQDSVASLYKACPQLMHVHLNREAVELNPLLNDVIRPRLVARAAEQRKEAEARVRAAEQDKEQARDEQETMIAQDAEAYAQHVLRNIPTDAQLENWDVSRLVKHVLLTARVGMGYEERTGIPQSLGVTEEMHARDAWAVFRDDGRQHLGLLAAP